MDNRIRKVSALLATALMGLLSVLVVFPVDADEQAPLPMTFQSPVSGATADLHRSYIPIVERSYTWHRMGIAPVDRSRSTAIFDGYPKYWYHTWFPACDDSYDPNDLYVRHIPMVRPGSVEYFLSSSFQTGPCNDGRPVLVLNEPEQADQDNLPDPGVALDIITRVANSSWKGPVYVGGTILHNEYYIDNMLSIWASTHEGSRLIPGVDGFHVHSYVNFVPGFSYDLRGNDLLQKVDADVQKLREFVAKRKAEGYSGAVVISEFGYLGRVSWIGRRDDDMAALLDEYVSGFESIPEALGWAWFSDYCPPSSPPPAPPVRDAWDVSNLVLENGWLTPAGEKYRALLQKFQ
jgi:hypothetical protein